MSSCLWIEIVPPTNPGAPGRVFLHGKVRHRTCVSFASPRETIAISTKPGTQVSTDVQTASGGCHSPADHTKGPERPVSRVFACDFCDCDVCSVLRVSPAPAHRQTEGLPRYASPNTTVTSWKPIPLQSCRWWFTISGDALSTSLRLNSDGNHRCHSGTTQPW